MALAQPHSQNTLTALNKLKSALQKLNQTTFSQAKEQDSQKVQNLDKKHVYHQPLKTSSPHAPARPLSTLPQVKVSRTKKTQQKLGPKETQSTPSSTTNSPLPSPKLQPQQPLESPVSKKNSPRIRMLEKTLQTQQPNQTPPSPPPPVPIPSEIPIEPQLSDEDIEEKLNVLEGYLRGIQAKDIPQFTEE